jgi:hypothetical protein
MKRIQTTKNPLKKSIPAYEFLKSQEKIRKMLVISKKKTIPWGMDFLIYRNL